MISLNLRMIVRLVCVLALLSIQASFSESSSIPKPKATIVNPNCKTIVCEQAHEQAKGLYKLALLDEFVSQTVFLLNDLMKNIDGELEKSANSLLRYIHPHCDSTQQILQEVIQKQKGKQSASPALAQDIKPMDEDGVEEESSPSQTHGHNYQFRSENDGQNFVDKSYDDYSPNAHNSEDGSAGQQFSNYDTSETTNRNSGGFVTFGDSSTEDKFSSGWKGQKSEWKGIDRAQEEENKNSQKTWKFDSSEQSSAHKAREGKTIKLDSRSGVTGYKVCKGVDRGSAFWVPGLDQWCLENCSKGYCPKTHCEC